MRFLESTYFKAIIVLLTGLVLYVECVVNHNKDFDVFIAASKLVYQKQNCYEVWLSSGTSGLKYFYSPLFAVLLFPLKDFPQIANNFIWLGLNLLVVYRIFRLIPFYLSVNNWSRNKKQLFYALFILATVRFFHDTFSLGQMTLVLVWGSLESFRLFRNGNNLLGAALLALIINVKIIPVALLGYLFYSKHFKAAFCTVAFLAIFFFLPALFIGFEFNAQLHANWFASITATNAGSIMDDNGRQSLSSFVPALLMETPLKFGLRRNVASLNHHQVQLVLNISRLALLVLLAFMFRNPFKRTITRASLFYNLALICLATPLFFPHQGKYAFFYLLPAQAWCIYHIIKLHRVKQYGFFTKLYRSALGLFILSFVLLTLTTDGLIGRQANTFCEYFQCITVGSICLLVTMLMLRPKAEPLDAVLVSAGE